ncbi:carbohydrate kinase family protein [Halocynthiibacter sp.]|uniref:carbohydrate kinase family protein n=1 Tax=Halocynthiibacter sp. TaxID=1979210 RepID=UPI003C56BEF2
MSAQAGSQLRPVGRSGGVLCIGRLYCDLVFGGIDGAPAAGTESFATQLRLSPGGGACITSAWLEALGRRAWLCSTLPSGPFTDAITGELALSGPDLSLCSMADPTDDPQVTVVLPHGADRSFVTRRAGPAATLPEALEIEPLPLSHLHIGELATLVEMPEILSLARDLGLTISLDCGWDDSLSRDDVLPLIQGVDVFLPNRTEQAWLGSLDIPLRTAPLTVVKMGADGAKAYCPSGEGYVAGEPADVVDATGAGDAFNAGFLHSWIDGIAVPDCIARGNYCGRQAIGALGGTGALRGEMRDI